MVLMGRKLKHALCLTLVYDSVDVMLYGKEA